MKKLTKDSLKLGFVLKQEMAHMKPCVFLKKKVLSIHTEAERIIIIKGR